MRFFVSDCLALGSFISNIVQCLLFVQRVSNLLLLFIFKDLFIFLIQNVCLCSDEESPNVINFFNFQKFSIIGQENRDTSITL